MLAGGGRRVSSYMQQLVPRMTTAVMVFVSMASLSVESLEAVTPPKLLSCNTTLATTNAQGVAVVGEKLLFATGSNSTRLLQYDPAGSAGCAAWSLLASPRLSAARSHAVSVGVVSGRWAAWAGGETGAQAGNTDAIDLLDTTTGKMSLYHMSVARSFLGGTSHGDTIYLGGGETAADGDSAAVDVLDLLTGVVTSNHTLSVPRKKLAAATAGDFVLFGGGYTSGEKNTSSRGYSDVVDLYDTISKIWSTQHLSQARQYITATSLGAKAIFAGGFCSPCTGQPGTDRSIVADVFDSRTKTWTAHKLSQRRSNLAITNVGGRFALIGGGTTDAPATADASISRSDVVDVYDSITNAWSVLKMSASRCCLGAAGGNSSAAFCGGTVGQLCDLFTFPQSLTNEAAPFKADDEGLADVDDPDREVDYTTFLLRSDPVWGFSATDAKTLPSAWCGSPPGWRTFLCRHSNTRLAEPHVVWRRFQSAFTGNGMLGLQVQTIEGNCQARKKDCVLSMAFHVSRADAWDVRMEGSQYAVGDSEFDRTQMPSGVFELQINGTDGRPASITTGTMRTHLANATITGVVQTTTAGPLSFTAFVHARRHLFVFELAGAAVDAKRAELVFVPERAFASRGDGRPNKLYKNNPSAVCDRGSCEQTLLAGGSFATAWASPRAGLLLATISNDVPARHAIAASMIECLVRLCRLHRTLRHGVLWFVVGKHQAAGGGAAPREDPPRRTVGAAASAAAVRARGLVAIAVGETVILLTSPPYFY